MAVIYTIGLLSPFLLATACAIQEIEHQYFPTVPGTTWRMHTTNYLTGGGGNVTVTIEPETTWGGYPTTPWRFRKDHIDSYWAAGQNADLHWYVVPPSYSFGPKPFFNQFLWVLGHDSIDRATGQPSIQVAYRAVQAFPAYALVPKQLVLPYEIHNDQGTMYEISLSPQTFPVTPNPVAVPPYTPGAGLIAQFGSWWVRVQMRTRVPRAVFSKQWREADLTPRHVLQIDYFESSPYQQTGAPAGSVLTDYNLIRESWYFEANVGLVEIRSKQTHAATPSGSAYYDDIDGTSDEMVAPDLLVERMP